MHSICKNLQPSLLDQCPQLKISNINQIPKSNHRLFVHAKERWRRKSRLCFMFQFASGGVLAFAIYALLGDGFTKYMAHHHSLASQTSSGLMQEHHNSTLFLSTVQNGSWFTRRSLLPEGLPDSVAHLLFDNDGNSFQVQEQYFSQCVGQEWGNRT